MYERDDFRYSIREHSSGFIFLGTPHKCAQLTILGHFVSLFGYWLGSSTNLLDIIKRTSAFNEKLHRDFMMFLRHPPRTTVCIFEACQERIWGMPLTHV